MFHIANALHKLEIKEYRMLTIARTIGGKNLSDQRILRYVGGFLFEVLETSKPHTVKEREMEACRSRKTYALYSDLRREYPLMERGEGVYLWDEEGKKYLDASSGGVLTVNIGYGVSDVIDAMRFQAERLPFIHRLVGFTTRPNEELAAKVASMAPEGIDKVFFVNSGSDAVETAIKLARVYNLDRGEAERFKIISAWQSYHGNTMGALNLTGISSRRKGFYPYLQHSSHIPPPSCYRCFAGMSYPSCDLLCAKELERTIRQEGPESVCAFIAEPVMGGGAGAVVPPKEYWPMIRKICDRYGVLLIADEIMCGIGRTGKYFAMDHWGVAPDIIAAGKGLGSGYAPLFAILVHERVVETIRKGSGGFSAGHTYVGSPLACGVGTAVLDYMERHELIQRSQKMGEVLLRSLETLRTHPSVGDIRGLGLMAALEFVREKSTREPYPREAEYSRVVSEEALRQGLIFLSLHGNVDGILGDYILLGPAFIITEEQIGELVEKLDRTLTEVENRIMSDDQR